MGLLGGLPFERIFKELLAYSIGDIYTPWRWKNYLSYDEKH
jgi:serine-type D-Ala-D-Ala carboxypeptidase/endopeptidase